MRRSDDILDVVTPILYQRAPAILPSLGPRRPCGSKRKANSEGRSVARLALDLDPAVMSFDNPLGNRQAKAAAAGNAGPRRVGAVEAVEYEWEIPGSDSHARVLDRQDCLISLNS